MGQTEVMVQVWRVLGSAPYLLVLLGGVAACLACASRAPRTALIVGMALGIELITFLVMPLITTWLFAAWPADAADQLNMRIFVNALVYSIPSSISLGLLIWAAFGKERAATVEYQVVGE